MPDSPEKEFIKDLDAVLLCGGEGLRLRPVIGERQKTMAEFQGVPFLELLIKYLQGQGLRRFILCAGYRSEQVEAYFQAKDLGCEIVFSREDKPLGTGGAIKGARPLIQSDPFFALNGDSFCELRYAQLLQFHQRNSAAASLAVVRASDLRDFGKIVLDHDQRVLSFEEKAGGEKSLHSFGSAGIYCFNQSVFSLMPTHDSFSIEKDFFPRLVQERFFAMIFEGFFMDIGTPQRFQLAQEYLMKGERREQ